MKPVAGTWIQNCGGIKLSLSAKIDGQSDSLLMNAAVWTINLRRGRRNESAAADAAINTGASGANTKSAL